MVRRWRLIGWSAIAGVLLLPLISMRFSDQVNWSLADLIVAATVLGSAGVLIEVAARRYNGINPRGSYLAGMFLAVVACVSQFWVNAAVGIIGQESDDRNLLFNGVVLAAVLGMFITRLAPRGMSLVMALAAILQAALIVCGLLLEWGREIFLTTPFALLWLASAVCFHNANPDGPDDRKLQSRHRDPLSSS